MCGITGAVAFNESGKSFLNSIDSSTATLQSRGPDNKNIFLHNNVALGHTRLSIIDTSSAADQPFTDDTGRFTIIFNGEFFNYKIYREELLSKGIKLFSESDTEVLLHLYILYGSKCLKKINGFFSFAIYDKENESLFIARDRFGIKPLLIYQDSDKLLFSSEMKALLQFGIKKEIDQDSLFTYFQLNYIPPPHSIFKNVSKLEPGHYIEIKNNNIIKKKYYEIPFNTSIASSLNYEQSQNKLYELLEESVKERLIADVPLGAFLSGGIDSSIITALASKHTKHLKTFSIGFKDEPFFDETHYAKLVSVKWKTDHTVFSLSNNDLFENLNDALNYIDEPFADSSALAVYVLSKHTRKHVTVALSGDGADEMFAGYNKHKAEYKIEQGGLLIQLIKVGHPFWKLLPKSRNSKFKNTIRQLEKLAEGSKLNTRERYWKWASLASENSVSNLLLKKSSSKYNERKNEYLNNLDSNSSINDVLFTDMKIVLPGDMLQKVDLMSMANSLEVRPPFLDHNVVDFAFSLPEKFKIDRSSQKKILKDTFKSLLPEEIYTRNKKGFEVPLLKWFQTDLKDLIVNDLLKKEFIQEQKIFEWNEIEKLIKRIFSNNPGDSVATVWALVVFQHWYKKYMM